MPRLVRIALAFAAAVGLSTLAIAGACALDSDDALLRRLLQQNKAAQTRMDAFDLRLRLAADRAIRSICDGCMPSATPPPVRVARSDAARRRARHLSERNRVARQRAADRALAGLVGLRPALSGPHRPPREASALPPD